ncbi:hypothetical protein PENTCL1PPCAC_7191 [Pristionchus entomophagus]|uniref:C3H1-type domain-containing protein n=1 Tax=Pristionchus entomophagus TaxID=358040 RepID=A0AAV5SNS2_9BILA|nr:hypothetical protein PENTCL1PPCAC_7191 [Pristionchus entomophagus]
MYAFPPPQHTDKTFANAVRPTDHSTHSNNQSQTTSDRYLPSLLHTTSSAPPTQNLQQSQHTAPPPGIVPVQGIQHPLNNILLQTAQFMAMNEQLRKEIEQYANLRVRAASLKGGPEAQVAAAAAAAYFLAPPVGPHGTTGTDLASSLAPFGARVPPPPNGRKSPLPDSYKTVMCQAWLEASMCSFGENCRFAHGEHELRPMTQPQRANRKYKTKLCEKYTNTGLCPYGTRCLFIHPDNSGGNNAYIRPDKLEELKKRQQEVDGTKKGANGEEETTKTHPPLMAMESNKMVVPPPLISMERGVSDQKTSSMLVTSTPMMTMMNHTGKQPVARMMNIGVTPIRPRQSLRPHPSWPLEPTHYFDRIGREEEEEESETDVEHREMMQAAEAVAAEAAASVLMNSSCSSYVSLPPPMVQHQQQLQHQHLPRAASPVFGLDHTGSDDTSSSSPIALMDCGTPCSGSGSSSGYLSENGCCGVITPASGLSSGTASPLDALMLSGGTNSLGSSPPSMLLDSGDFSLFHHSSLMASSIPSSSLSIPLGMTISLPPMSSSGCWGGSPSDPFRTAFDIDKMAREMAKEFGGL